MFFFEKKNQKTFILCRRLTGEVRDSARKSFLVLFFKKELLPCAQRTLGVSHGSPARL
jgi:hypothetical protein